MRTTGLVLVLVTLKRSPSLFLFNHYYRPSRLSRRAFSFPTCRPHLASPLTLQLCWCCSCSCSAPSPSATHNCSPPTHSPVLLLLRFQGFATQTKQQREKRRTREKKGAAQPLTPPAPPGGAPISRRQVRPPAGSGGVEWGGGCQGTLHSHLAVFSSSVEPRLTHESLSHSLSSRVFSIPSVCEQRRHQNQAPSPGCRDLASISSYTDKPQDQPSLELRVEAAPRC